MRAFTGVILTLSFPVQPIATQQYTDPTADRGFVAATGRTLPQGAMTITGYADLLSVAVSAGVTDWLTVNLGSPPWTVLDGDVVLFGSLKVRAVNVGPLAASIGVFAVGDVRPDDLSYGAVWPFASVSVAEGPLELSGTLGYGRGDEFFDINLDREWAYQATAGYRFASWGKGIVEWLRLGQRDVGIAGARVFHRRFFFDLGVITEPGFDDVWPWGSVGFTLR